MLNKVMQYKAMLDMNNLKIAVIGLGYVGLPLAVEFGKQRPVIGFDINSSRIAQLVAGTDHTLEVSDSELAQASQLQFSSDMADLKDCNFFIVTALTPIDAYKQPDFPSSINISTAITTML